MIRRPPRSTHCISSAASDVYKRQALITIYDLSKIVNPDLSIEEIRLLVKQGGKSGLWLNPNGLPEFLSHLK